jgi:hypothetical protein
VLAQCLEHPDAWVRVGACYAIGVQRRVELWNSVSAVPADRPLLAALVAETRTQLAGLPVPPVRTAIPLTADGQVAGSHPLLELQDGPPAPAIEGAYAVLDQLLALHRVPLFRELTLDQLQALSPLLETREYLAGEQMVQEGGEGHELFVVLAGQVRIIRGGPGQTVILAELGPQDYFGEMALLAERPRAATAIAVTDCQVGVLTTEHLFAVLAERPEVSLAVIQVLSNRLASANERLATGHGNSAPPPGPHPPFDGEAVAGLA